MRLSVESNEPAEMILGKGANVPHCLGKVEM